jgi:cytoskeleton protein RodZ
MHAMPEREKEITDNEDQEPATGAMMGVSTPSAVGAMLRATRLRYGWDLEDIERALRIRFVHLEAIEEGRFEDLPGPAYAVGFVRAYADHLGLDREEVVTQFRDEISALPHRTQLNFPTPIPESRVPSGAIIMISILIAAAAYGGWYFLSLKNRGAVEAVSEVPKQIAEMFKPNLPGTQPETPPGEAAAPAAHEEPAPAPQTGATTPIVQAPPAPNSAAVQFGPAISPAPPAATPAPAPAPTQAPAESTTAETQTAATTGAEHKPAESTGIEQFAPPAATDQGAADGQGSVFGKANTNARIVIRANADSWVQVRDNDGELILTRMLRAGDSYRVPNKSGLTLLTGNAGALEIYVDGRLAPALGPGGAIRRDVSLDADRLLAGTAVDN